MLESFAAKLGVGASVLAILTAIIGIDVAWHKQTTAELETWKAAALGSEAAFGVERGVLLADRRSRDTERGADIAAVSGDAAACDARIAKVRASDAAITTLLEKPHATDPKTGCPVPGLYSAGELWNAIAPPP
jgi:hypothetical protein